MRRDRSFGLSLLSAGLLMLAFATPLRSLWLQPHAPLWIAYALWGASVLGIYAAERARKGDR